MRAIIISTMIILLSSGCSWKKRLPDPPAESQNINAQFGNDNEQQKKTYVEPTRDSRSCESAKEYITTIEYLRNDEDFALNEKMVEKVAAEVAQGCTNAANRFIKVSRALSKSNVSGKNAIEAGLKFAKKSSKEMYAFLTVFSQCFLEDGLDMDIDSSLKIAHSLSSEFSGDSYVAVKDFQNVVEFCMNHEDFHFEKAECGKLAGRVAKQGENSKESVVKAFTEAFDFLVSSDGPHLEIKNALQVAEKLVGISTKAVTNYIDTFKYATSKSGLELGNDKAHPLALEIASYTGPEVVSAVEKTTEKEPSKKQKK